MDGLGQPVGARREAPCRCLSQASNAGAGEGLGGDCLRKNEIWPEEDRKSHNPIPKLKSRKPGVATTGYEADLWRMADNLARQYGRCRI